MRKFYLLLLLSNVLSYPCTKAQSPLPRTSAIETIAGGGPARTSGREFNILSVSGLAADSKGNIYFSIQARSQVFRLSVDGQVVVFVGNGVREKPVEGASAVDSPLSGPRSLAVDHLDNLLIVSDEGLVRVDAATRALSTVFTIPYRQHGTAYAIRDILEMVVGPDGNLYFSDGGDHRIKSYSFDSGAVTVLAGDGTIGSTQAGVVAVASPLKYPEAVAVGSDGTVYFTTLEPAVFRLSPKDKKLEPLSIALPEEKGALGEYDVPSHVALDQQDHLFVAQANRSRVLRLDLKTGIASVYAGTGQQGFNGDGIPAVQATVTGPEYLVSDSSGNLIISENHRIRSIKPSTGLISTRAGNGNAIVDDERTLAIHARLREPANAVAAPDGSIYIASSFNNRLLRLARNEDLVSVAGGGSYIYMERRGGQAAQVALNQPQGIWVENHGVFFADDDNRIVRQLDPDAKAITNFATTPKKFSSAGLFLYYAGALVSDGNYFFLSDPNAGSVWRISRKDASVELYAGKSPGTYGPSDDPGPLRSPSGLALDEARSLYIADGQLGRKDGRIVRVDHLTRQMTTVLSDLRQPSGLAFRSRDILCFSETGGHQVRCVNLKTHVLNVLAGTGLAGFSGDGGPAECAQLNRPLGISFDQGGDLLIADTGNQRVRRVHPGLRGALCRAK